MPPPARVAPTGLDHVTAVAAAPDRNVGFYARTLGLRLVRRTVDFDAPRSWHLYHGGTAGTPGSLLTFFPWPDVPRGREGAGLATAVAFSVPEGSLGWWARRLRDLGVEVAGIRDRQYFRSIDFREPGGVLFEIATDEPGFTTDEPLLELGRALRLPPWLEPDREQIAAALPDLKA